MGNVVLFVKLLGWRRQTILTLIAFFSDYGGVLLQRRCQDRVMTDRWSLVFVKVLSPIPPINWFFPQNRRNRWDELTQHISAGVLHESTLALDSCELSDPISILTMIKSLCSHKILQFVPFGRSKWGRVNNDGLCELLLILVFIIFACFKGCRLLLHLIKGFFRWRLTVKHVDAAILFWFKEIALIIVEIYLG